MTALRADAVPNARASGAVTSRPARRTTAPMTLRPLPLALVFILAACGASDPSPPAAGDAAADSLPLASGDAAPADAASGCARDDGLPAADCNGARCMILNNPFHCGACGVACGEKELCVRRDGAFRCVAR